MKVMGMAESRCWVCLRITPKEVLKLVHIIFSEDPKLAREIGLESSRLIEQGYREKPWFFCGRAKKGILSGLFYLLGIQCGHGKFQRQIADVLETSEITVRSSYNLWLEDFPSYFSDFQRDSKDNLLIDGQFIQRRFKKRQIIKNTKFPKDLEKVKPYEPLKQME